MSPRQQGGNDSGRDRGFGQSARERAIDAYDNARDSAGAAGRKVADGIGEAPLLALAGGLAAGALLAALLPASRKEQELLGPVADRIKDKASDAASAAKEAGQQRLGELGLTREAGSDTLRTILDGAGDAAKVSAEAAVAAIRRQD